MHPSKSIRKGYGTVEIDTFDGKIHSGMLVREDDNRVVLRDAGNLTAEIEILKADIDYRGESKNSMMPDGLMATFKSQRDVLDLLSYLFAISEGGPERASELRPSDDQLIVKDDIANLNHAAILRKVKKIMPRAVSKSSQPRACSVTAPMETLRRSPRSERSEPRN